MLDQLLCQRQRRSALWNIKRDNEFGFSGIQRAIHIGIRDFLVKLVNVYNNAAYLDRTFCYEFRRTWKSALHWRAFTETTCRVNFALL